MEIKELDNVQQAEVRALARSEIASFAGLVMRRVQILEQNAGDPDVGNRVALDSTMLSGIFGEVLRDFGSTADEPGV